MTTAIHMTIRLNGEAIEGEGVSHGETGFIECIAFTDGITTDQAPTGRSLGRRHPEPIVARKRIDRTTPRLLAALSQNEQVDATFTFHRTTADGVSEHFFTVGVAGGRIIGIERSWQADLGPEQENVRIAPLAVTWTHEPTGESFESRPRGVV
jgi:type VI secretion system secreted protein Hcp